MLFQYTYQAILDGRKTQTRRVRKPSDQPVYDDDGKIEAVLVNGREKWHVGKTYSVQPGRGKPQIARIRITAIDSENVTDINDAAARAEGSADREDFLRLWVEANGKANAEADAWVLHIALIAD